MRMNKRIAKKTHSIILMSALLLGFVACGRKEELSLGGSSAVSQGAESSKEVSAAGNGPESVSNLEPEVQKPLSFTVLLSSQNEIRPGELAEFDKLIEDINEYTGCDVSWEFSDNATYEEQMKLRYVSGNLPEVSVVTRSAAFIKACDDGLFWDLTDYIQDYPNLACINDSALGAVSINGRIYCVPRARPSARNGLGYRKDWADKLGLDEPKTIDDFYNMLYKFAKSDPDGNGLNDTYGMAVTEYMGPWNIIQLWFGAPNKWGLDENGNLVPEHLTEEYKKALAFCRKLVSEGLVNPDWAETSSKDWDTMFRSDKYGCVIDTWGRTYKAQEYYEKEGLQTEMALLPGVDAGYGYKCWPTAGNGGLAINKQRVTSEEDLKRILQFLNDINDAYITNIIEAGYENVNYKLDDEGYYVRMSDDEKIALGVTTRDFRAGFNQVLSYSHTEEETAKLLTTNPAAQSELRQLADIYLEECVQYCVTNIGDGYISETYSECGEQLDKIMEDARIQYINGVIDENGLDNAISTWLQAGGQKVIEEMNELYHSSNN